MPSEQLRSRCFCDISPIGIVRRCYSRENRGWWKQQGEPNVPILTICVRLLRCTGGRKNQKKGKKGNKQRNQEERRRVKDLGRPGRERAWWAAVHSGEGEPGWTVGGFFFAYARPISGAAEIRAERSVGVASGMCGLAGVRIWAVCRRRRNGICRSLDFLAFILVGWVDSQTLMRLTGMVTSTFRPPASLRRSISFSEDRIACHRPWLAELNKPRA